VSLLQRVKERLNQLEVESVISRVVDPTPWCSPMTVVPKDGGRDVRICVDLTEFNKSVIREPFPIQSVEHSLSQLG